MSSEIKLSAWLEYIEAFQRKSPRLDLEPLITIAKKCDVYPSTRVITVTGTNGKGSCVEMLTAGYVDAGYSVGTYTSPHLFSFNERIRIQKKPVDDDSLCEAFRVIEKARGDYILTYFEFITLAALWIFKRANLDVVILEVGIGGRLDVTNIIDADLAIITSIGLDHAHVLGDTRESVAKEKAGIFRSNQHAVCGDFDPPESLKKLAKTLDTHVSYIGKDFDFTVNHNTWQFKNKMLDMNNIPLPRLFIPNAACALQAISLLQDQLPVSDMYKAAHSIVLANLPGRCEIQKMPNGRTCIFDVAHNPQAVSRLSGFIQAYKQKHVIQKTIAIFSMFADKDIENAIKAIKTQIDEWHVAEIRHPRAASKQQIDSAFSANNIIQLQNECLSRRERMPRQGQVRGNIGIMKSVGYIWHDSLGEAYQNLENTATESLVVIFGSFFVVTEIAFQDKVD